VKQQSDDIASNGKNVNTGMMTEQLKQKEPEIISQDMEETQNKE
jgi:hypothetical protein